MKRFQIAGFEISKKLFEKGLRRLIFQTGPKLTQENLSGVDCTGADLSGSDLSNANLNWTVLK